MLREGAMIDSLVIGLSPACCDRRRRVDMTHHESKAGPAGRTSLRSPQAQLVQTAVTIRMDPKHPLLLGKFADLQGRPYVMLVNNSQTRSVRVAMTFPGENAGHASLNRELQRNGVTLRSRI